MNAEKRFPLPKDVVTVVMGLSKPLTATPAKSPPAALLKAAKGSMGYKTRRWRSLKTKIPCNEYPRTVVPATRSHREAVPPGESGADGSKLGRPACYRL